MLRVDIDMVTHLFKYHANHSPARTTRATTLLSALSLDCRLHIQRCPMGGYGYDYVYRVVGSNRMIHDGKPLK